MKRTPWYGEGPVRKMKPTLKHRRALFECMLGTLYAVNDAGEKRYFDYDWEAAHAFAGVNEPGRDVRLARDPRTKRWTVYVLRK